MPPTRPESELVTCVLRDALHPVDRDNVRRIVSATGFFRPDEIDVAVELVDTRFEKGDASGYFFVFAEVADEVWLVSFMGYDLGFFDNTENRVEPVGENPFELKVLPMSSE